jgi:hypothetical protein
MALYGIIWVKIKDLEPTLDDSDLGVESINQANRGPNGKVVVLSQAISIPFDHRGEPAVLRSLSKRITAWGACTS